jgi:hypothetical protein
VADFPAIRARLAYYAAASKWEYVPVEHYREDVGALLAMVDAMRAEVKRLRVELARCPECDGSGKVVDALGLSSCPTCVARGALAPHPGGGRG